MADLVSVEAVELVKVYTSGKKVRIKALDGVTMKAYKNEILGVMGPSGSGKTTLLNILGGLDKATKGRVIINGTEITNMSEEKLARFRLKNIGFVFQFYNLINSLTVLENVELPLALMSVPRSERKEKALELLRILGLIHRINAKPGELSGGEQQRVAIARALITNPTVVLMDEPTGNLDSENARNLMRFVKKVKESRDVTFIIASHDPIVIRECERTYILRDGKIIAEISGREAVERYSKM